MEGFQLPLQSGYSCSCPERMLMLGTWGNVPARCTADASWRAGGSSASHARDALCHCLGTEHPETQSSFVIYELFELY